MPLVIILVVAVGLANFFYLLPPVINWDEGTHALWGFKEWLALRSGDFPLFWELSRAQFAYPPLGSWFIAITNLPFEFSMNLARFSSTLGFIAAGILLWMVAKELNKSNKTNKTNWTNWIVLFLFLTSPAILFYSVTVFKESWGMALTLLTFYLYFRAVDNPVILASEARPESVEKDSGQVFRPLRVRASESRTRAQDRGARMTLKQRLFFHFLTGLSLTLLFFEKYNYALLLVLVLGLEGTVELGLLGMLGKLRNLREVKKFAVSQIALFLPFFLFASWWILTPTNKLSWFLDIMRSDWNPVTVGIGNSWQYLTFFVQSIRVSYVFSDVLFWGLVAGYVWAMRDLWRKKIRVLWLFFTINFILGTLHSINLQDRYILTSVPALFLLAGYEWQQVLAALRVLSTRLALLLLVLLVLFDLRNFPTLLKSNATHMLLSPMYNESDYKDTLFDFNKSHWPYKITQNESESPEGVIDYILENMDVNKPIEITGATAEISPDWWELRRQLRMRQCTVYGLRCTVQSNVQKFLVTIEVKLNSWLYTYDYRRANAWQLGKVREVEEMWGDKLLKEKDFKELGVVVRIYSL